MRENRTHTDHNARKSLKRKRMPDETKKKKKSSCARVDRHHLGADQQGKVRRDFLDEELYGGGGCLLRKGCHGRELSICFGESIIVVCSVVVAVVARFSA